MNEQKTKQNKDQLQLLADVVNWINALKTKFRSWTHTITMEEHGSKDYFMINVHLSYGNSQYQDCVVISFDEGPIAETEIREKLKEIETKAQVLLK